MTESDKLLKDAQELAEKSAASKKSREDLRRIIAFDRFLARLATNHAWSLKGGYALETLFPEKARPADDIDMAYDIATRITDGGFPDLEDSEKNLNDGFSYAATLIQDRQPEFDSINYGLCRYAVECKFNREDFFRFQVDVSLGGMYPNALVSFVSGFELVRGASPFRIRQFPKVVQLAEKLHAYSLPLPPYGTDSKWKAKHLADIVLLVDNGLPADMDMGTRIEGTFKQRNTHTPPKDLPNIRDYADGPAEFERMTRTMRLSTKNCDEAFALAQTLWIELRKGMP